MLQVDKILQKFTDFPTLPTIYIRLTDTMANPNSTASDVAKIISYDQASSAKILKAANSSFYGIHGKIDTITQAISFIGFEEVKNLLLTLTIIKLFADNKKKFIINPVDLWKHSIAVGVITKLLGKITQINKLENYFIAGIIHDIGKLFFYRYFPTEYAMVFEYAYENELTILDAEKEVLGITHTIAGELIAEKWKLPPSLQKCIGYHSIGTFEDEFDHLLACVHVADIAAYMLGIGNIDMGNGFIPEPNMKVWEYLNLPDDVFTVLAPEIIQNYEESIGLILSN
jgi:HD-like signal output (HDOD) protein